MLYHPIYSGLGLNLFAEKYFEHCQYGWGCLHYTQNIFQQINASQDLNTQGDREFRALSEYILGWPKSSATLAKKLIFASVAELFGQPNIIETTAEPRKKNLICISRCIYTRIFPFFSVICCNQRKPVINKIASPFSYRKNQSDNFESNNLITSVIH
jgi:hypothetical protein